MTKIKNPRWRNKRAKNASDLGKLDKYGYFQALIVENLHGILLRFWFYLKKITFINVIQGFSVVFFAFISRNIQLKCVELFNHMDIYAAESNVNHYQRGLVC